MIVARRIRAHQSAVHLARRRINPSVAHTVYTLIGFAWPAFGVIFLTLLCSTDWFAVNIVWYAPVAIVASLAIGHIIAMALESNAATRLFYFFKHGSPLLFYRRFASVIEPKASDAAASAVLEIGHPAITFGHRRVLFEAVDELYLTFLGTLELRSYAASGHVFERALEHVDGQALSNTEEALLNRPDVLLRVPLSILNLSEQKEFVSLFSKFNAHVVVNKRLTDRLQSPVVKGQTVVQAIGAAVLVFALCDVTYATFTWLELLKNYYGAQICMRHPEQAAVFLKSKTSEKTENSTAVTAQALYDRAEKLRLNPAPISWAYRALFESASSKAQLGAVRAETLYRLGRPDEAIAALGNVDDKSHGMKAKLQLVRYLVAQGKGDRAATVLDELIEKHKDVLLPRVYREALLAANTGEIEAKGADGTKKAAENASIAAVKTTYEKYLRSFDEEYFGDEPAWPPGGEKAIMEMWKRDDLTFLAERLLPGVRPRTSPGSGFENKKAP